MRLREKCGSIFAISIRCRFENVIACQSEAIEPMAPMTPEERRVAAELFRRTGRREAADTLGAPSQPNRRPQYVQIQLRCLDPQYSGQTWTLNFDGTVATLSDSHGHRIEFTPHKIAAVFQMPSFSRSITHFGIVGSTNVSQFDVTKDDLKKLKRILESALVASGPQAVRTIRNAAARDSVIGFTLATVGALLTVMSFGESSDRYTVLYGAILVGLAVMGRGLGGLLRYRRLTAASSVNGDA